MKMKRTTVMIYGVLCALFVGCARPDSRDANVLNRSAQAPSDDMFREPVRIRELGKLANLEIDESSGLAFSKRDLNVLWTHNDSGDAPRIFAFDLEGRDLGVFQVAGAKAVDWEDMSSVQRGFKSYLLIADVGDNWRTREDYRIYLVEEPPVNPGQVEASRVLRVSRTFVFRYEDGPQDCEGAAMDPRTETIYLVTKNFGWTCRIYTLQAAGVQDGEVSVAKAVATLELHQATAMDISPDGRRMVILTYGDAYEFVRDPLEDWPDTFTRRPSVIPMPRRPQGESVCYGPDNVTLYLTSERAPSPLWEVQRVPETN